MLLVVRVGVISTVMCTSLTASTGMSCCCHSVRVCHMHTQLLMIVSRLPVPKAQSLLYDSKSMAAQSGCMPAAAAAPRLDDATQACMAAAFAYRSLLHQFCLSCSSQAVSLYIPCWQSHAQLPAQAAGSKATIRAWHMHAVHFVCQD